MFIKPAKKVLAARSPSDWVHKIWLTCDDTIAVQFNRGQRVEKTLDQGPGAYRGSGGTPGVCCLYPGTQGNLAKELFQLAQVWPFAGEWVHRFLYKKFGYIKIVPPALALDCCGAQTCCPNVVLPSVLHASLVDGGSTAGNLTGTYPVTCSRLGIPDGAPGDWTWPLTGPSDPAPPLRVDFLCNNGVWQFVLNSGATAYQPSAAQCPNGEPFMVSFGSLTAPAAGGYWVMNSAVISL